MNDDTGTCTPPAGSFPLNGEQHSFALHIAPPSRGRSTTSVLVVVVLLAAVAAIGYWLLSGFFLLD